MIFPKKLHLKKDFTLISFNNDPYSHKTTITPNLNLISREITSSSQIQIILGRVFKLDPISTVLLIINNIKYSNSIIHKDFATGLKLLIELEVLLKKSDRLILHNQLTDMAVALSNKNILKNYFHLSKTYHFQPGIISYNLIHLIKFLSSLKNIPQDLTIYSDLSSVNDKTVTNFIKQSKYNFQDISV